MEQYWISVTQRKDRRRVHIDRENGITICGKIAKQSGLKRISRTEMEKEQIPTCTHCTQILNSKKFKNQKQLNYNQTKTGVVEMNKQKIKIPKKYEDEITNPKLKKFKSIIKNAKQKNLAIQNAIEEKINDEEIIPNIEMLKELLPELKQKLQESISDAYNEWEIDVNTANDCNHFCKITTLRNLTQTINAVQNL